MSHVRKDGSSTAAILSQAHAPTIKTKPKTALQVELDNLKIQFEAIIQASYKNGQYQQANDAINLQIKDIAKLQKLIAKTKEHTSEYTKETSLLTSKLEELKTQITQSQLRTPKSEREELAAKILSLVDPKSPMAFKFEDITSDSAASESQRKANAKKLCADLGKEAKTISTDDPICAITRMLNLLKEATGKSYGQRLSGKEADSFSNAVGMLMLCQREAIATRLPLLQQEINATDKNDVKKLKNLKEELANGMEFITKAHNVQKMTYDQYVEAYEKRAARSAPSDSQTATKPSKAATKDAVAAMFSKDFEGQKETIKSYTQAIEDKLSGKDKGIDASDITLDISKSPRKSA